MEKYFAQIKDYGICRHQAEFQTKEAREEWIKSLGGFPHEWNKNVYKLPYNTDFLIETVDADIVNLNDNYTIEEWVNSKVVQGRLKGNPEKQPQYVTGGYTTVINTGITNYYSGLNSITGTME